MRKWHLGTIIVPWRKNQEAMLQLFARELKRIENSIIFYWKK